MATCLAITASYHMADENNIDSQALILLVGSILAMVVFTFYLCLCMVVYCCCQTMPLKEQTRRHLGTEMQEILIRVADLPRQCHAVGTSSSTLVGFRVQWAGEASGVKNVSRHRCNLASRVLHDGEVLTYILQFPLYICFGVDLQTTGPFWFDIPLKPIVYRIDVTKC